MGYSIKVSVFYGVHETKTLMKTHRQQEQERQVQVCPKGHSVPCWSEGRKFCTHCGQGLVMSTQTKTVLLNAAEAFGDPGWEDVYGEAYSWEVEHAFIHNRGDASDRLFFGYSLAGINPREGGDKEVKAVTEEQKTTLTQFLEKVGYSGPYPTLHLLLDYS